MAMLAIASRKRRGMLASASATRLSKAARRTTASGGHAAGSHGARLVVGALILRGTPVAQRLGPADAAAVEDERVRGPGPAALRQRTAELRFDRFRLVRFGNAEAVGDPEDVP